MSDGSAGTPTGPGGPTARPTQAAPGVPTGGAELSAISEPPITDEPKVRLGSDEAHSSDRILTIPNALSALRLLGVPVFLWLLLATPHRDGWAFAVLAMSAVTDWADGKLARLLGQYSKLGELLDPAADRLYIFATLVAFVVRGFLPWWVAALIVGRDAILAVGVPIVRRHGYPALPVHYIGKAATFCLLYAFPLLLLALGGSTGAGSTGAGSTGGGSTGGGSTLAHLTLPFGIAFTVWGVVLYLWSGALYARQVTWVIRRTPLAPRRASAPPGRTPAQDTGVAGG